MSAQVAALRARWVAGWQARDARERLVIAALLLVIGCVLVISIGLTVQRSRAVLRADIVPELRERAAQVERQAAEYERLRTAPKVTPSQTDLRALVQAQAGAAGLTRALQNIEAADADHAKVVFGAVAFADWLTWVVSLEAQQVRVESCRIEALSTPGAVSVTATLVRPGRQ